MPLRLQVSYTGLQFLHLPEMTSNSYTLLQAQEAGSQMPGGSACFGLNVYDNHGSEAACVTISISGSTSIPFPLYFAIHFPILFKSSFTISITKLFYFQPFYYSAFHYSAFYYSAFYYSAFYLLLSLLLLSLSIIQLYYSATFLLV